MSWESNEGGGGEKPLYRVGEPAAQWSGGRGPAHGPLSVTQPTHSARVAATGDARGRRWSGSDSQAAATPVARRVRRSVSSQSIARRRGHGRRALPLRATLLASDAPPSHPCARWASDGPTGSGWVRGGDASWAKADTQTRRCLWWALRVF